MNAYKVLISIIVVLFHGCTEVSTNFWFDFIMAGKSDDGSDAANAKVMSGWEMHEYGGIDALTFSQNILLPQIKSPTDVLVEVIATSVNPLDQLQTVGYGRTGLNTLRWFNKINEFPLILGREFSGIVKEKGDKVRDDIQIGDKVWGLVPVQQPGAHAEYVVVDQSTITRKPQNIDDVEAAGTLFAGLTVWSSLYITGLIGGLQGAKTSAGGGSGKHICILGASGGVGSIAVQIAKAENLKITATCGTDSVDLIKSLGADVVIDYRKDNLTEKFTGQSFDIILDAAGLGADYASKMPWKFSQYITLQPPVANDTDRYGLVFGSIKSAFTFVSNNVKTICTRCGLLKWGFFVPSSHGIEFIRKHVENGKIRSITDSVYDFDSMKDAFRKVEDGHLRGKVIVKIKSKQ